MVFTVALALSALLATVQGHLVLTYPGSRGNSLFSNGTLPMNNGAASAMTIENGTATYPFGMEFLYPCGGIPQTTNRTLWPVTGGAVGFQPGWASGHQFALIYINIGIIAPGTTAPPNMSHPVAAPFQIVGPSNNEYMGEVCIPRVTMPTGINFNIGDNITIQVIETTQHGASLYSCVDVTLADPKDVPEVNSSNCQNTTNIGYNILFTSANLTSAASMSFNSPSAGMLSTTILFSIMFVAFLL